MAKIFIYKDFDLIAELEKAIELSSKYNWEQEFHRTQEKIRFIIDALKETVEVMLQDC